MHITIVTPAAAGSRAGNRATANRWAGFLRQLGHRVKVSTDYRGQPTDLLLALHAWRSAAAVQRFREDFPSKPLIVALTGTDIYHFQHTEPATTRASMAAADTLIALHPGVARQIPPELSERLRVVHQSAQAPAARQAPLEGRFEVCVIGHLRHEKDSLRTALAVRDLPESSRIQVVALGKAHDEDWAAAARAEMDRNPRYHWRGEVPQARVREMMARARLMVISSRMEGGANVVSEACVAGLPVIASDIDGNRGLLGDDYPGYYPVEDTQALKALLLRAEQDPQWLTELREHCQSLAGRFTREAESAALAGALEHARESAQSR
ncbi:MAG: selenoneine biosynthesis selenosugar synthase SenB [Oleiphilaceae bacterium]|nr:selenoneine biosynthesis selenosugar synthase SenB [Oleiphilaceae bacterium]